MLGDDYLLPFLRADQRRMEGCVSALHHQLGVLMGLDSLSFASHQCMRYSGEEKSAMDSQQIEAWRVKQLRKGRGGDDNGVERSRSF